MGKKLFFFFTVRPLWFGGRVHVPSVGQFYFYAQRPEYPDVAPSCSHGETLRVSGGTSLDVAVVIRAVGLRHVHLPHGVAHVVHPVPAGRHALVDAVQALGLLEAGDLVLWGEPTDGYEEKTHSGD